MAYDIGPRIGITGEAEFNNALKRINTTLKELGSEMQLVTSQFDGNQNSMDALRAKGEILTKQQEAQKNALELLNTQYEKQRSRLSELAQELEKAKTEHGENSTEVLRATKEYGKQEETLSKLQIAINKTQTRINKLDGEIQLNTKYLKEAEESTTQTATSIDEYGKSVKEASEETRVFGDVLKANLTSEAIIAGVKALGSAMKSIADYAVSAAAYADDILTLSAITGLTTAELQEFKYMEELIDVSLDTMTSSMTRQIRAMQSAQLGLKAFVEAYDKLNIKIADSNGALRNHGDVYWEVIEALGRMSNETERDAIAMQLMGRSARDLIPLISLGREGIQEFADEAHRAGAVLSEETLSQLGAADDALQRLYKASDIAKRKFGIEMAPAVEQAATNITRRISDMDDTFARVAGNTLNALADGLLIILDNADKVAAGLGGIGAAMAAFKATQWIDASVSALYTLTTATKTATAATTALNAAQMASPWGLLSATIGGTVAALTIYNSLTNESVSSTKRLINEVDQLIAEAEDLNKQIKESAIAYQEQIKSIETEYGAAHKLTDQLYSLANQTKKTAEEKAQMVSIVDELNKLIPDLSLGIDDETGSLSLQREEVEKLIDANLRLNKVKAAQEELVEIAKKQIELEKTLETLEEKRKAALNEIQLLQKKYNDELFSGSDDFFTTLLYRMSHFGVTTEDKLRKAETAYFDLFKQINETKSAINDLDKDWSRLQKIIGDNSGITEAEKALNKLKESLSSSAMKEYSAEERRYAQIVEDTRQNLLDNLDDYLYQERKKLKKAQEDRLDSVRSSYDAELSELEKAHKKKLSLIDEEYTERLKILDEERYNQIKAIQNQIDQIQAQAAAEKKAEKDRQNQEKLNELILAVQTARTVSAKEKAQKELAEFEAQLAAEKLEEERKALLESLKQQQSKINEEFDIKEKALKAELDAQKSAAADDLAIQKNTLKAKYDELENSLREQFELESRELEKHLKKIKKQRESAIDEEIELLKAENQEKLKKYKEDADNRINQIIRSSDEYKKYLDESKNTAYDESKKIGQAVAQGFTDGLKSKSIEEEIAKYFKTPLSTAKQILGIRSPSKVFEEIGSQTVEGFIVGLNKRVADVNKAVSSTFGVRQTDTQQITESVINGIATALNVQPAIQLPAIKPVPVNLDGREIARIILPLIEEERRRAGIR